MTDAVEVEVVSDPADPAGPPGATRGSRAGAVAVVVVDLLVAFGFVVGFNQLATQSPVDAILPVALFSVGIAGLVALPAALLGARRGDDAPTRGFLTPPTPDAGFAAFALGLAALAAFGWQWGVAAQAALVGAQGIRLLLRAELDAVALLRGGTGRPDPTRVVLTGIEAVLFLVFAWAALADGSIRPFA